MLGRCFDTMLLGPREHAGVGRASFIPVWGSRPYTHQERWTQIGSGFQRPKVQVHWDLGGVQRAWGEQLPTERSRVPISNGGLVWANSCSQQANKGNVLICWREKGVISHSLSQLIPSFPSA